MPDIAQRPNDGNRIMEKTVTQWRLVLALRSPMQIGSGSLGMVEKTEMYIPGRVIWGALTACLVRQKIMTPTYNQFAKVGDLLGLHETFFSSFFPSFDMGVSEWLPIFTTNNRSWVKYLCGENRFDFQQTRSEKEMQAILISGQAGNATDPTRMATFEESLHETDMISPVIREGKKLIPVCYTGVVQLPEKISIPEEDIHFDITENTLHTVFNQCRLGGGRKRGWGMVRLLSIQKETNQEEILNTRDFPDGYKLLTSSVHPVQQTASIFNGRAFLAVYRQYCKKKGLGRQISAAQLCWETGTVLHASEMGAVRESSKLFTPNDSALSY
jgi:hypothetical protein